LATLILPRCRRHDEAADGAANIRVADDIYIYAAIVERLRHDDDEYCMLMLLLMMMHYIYAKITPGLLISGVIHYFRHTLRL